MKIRFFFLALWLLTVSLLSSQTNEELYSIHFLKKSITPEANAGSFLDSYNETEELIFQNKFFKIIQFYDIPTNEIKDSLNSEGIHLISYLPEKSYVASFSSSFNKKSPILHCIRSIIKISSEYKLSIALYEENYPEYSLAEIGKINLIASYFPNLEPAMVRQAFQVAGYAVVEQYDYSRAVKINVPISDINKIAQLPFVLFLEPVGPEPIPDNYTGRTLHRSNALATDYSTGRHYDGSGVVVELQDDGIIGPHIDYEGRIAEQFPTNNGGNHGDHCAGILMGAGNVDPKGEGTASGSTLYVYNAPPAYPGFYNIPDDYGNLGVRITSTSYSDGCNIGYNFLARMLDQQVRTYTSLMHVFSAGNDGNSNCGYGAGPGWGNITGGHKMGKNVITVGMVGWDDDLSDISSRGPAHDGRIKPDLVAKGRDVYSTVDPNTYDFKLGTSMSCPAVAGTFAQLFQAYREHYAGQDPKAELMKAILLNTTDDLGNPGPDFKFGYGRINALRAVKVIEEARFDSGYINQGDINSFQVDVPSGVEQLRVMISWTDYEAVQFSNWTLVNNLDLTITDPEANTWLPWKLSHYPDPDSLDLPAFQGVDDRNNVEQITIDNPQAGTFMIDIEGFSIPQGPQSYALVWEFITDDVILTYPVGGESLVPGDSEVIRWDAFGTDGTFLLQVSMDNGSNWDTIIAELPGEERFYLWTVPPAITGKALLSITKGSSVSITEAPFSIIGVPCNFEINWACEEFVHLSWSPVMGATSYEILTLGEKYMEPLETTTNNSVIALDPNIDTDTWFSVRAIGPDEAIGRRAIAIDRQAGPFNCFPIDVMIEAIPTATWGIYQSGTMDLTDVTVMITVRNFGIESIINLPLKYQLDNNDVVGEIYSGTIEPNEVLTFQFTETIDISTVGEYSIKAWVDHPDDQNPDNDLVESPIEVIDGTSVSLGYEQTFDNWSNCTSAPACELIICELEDGWINLDNNIYDEHDWRTYSGNTPSPFTGPDSDHTTGNSSGQYLYMEPSISCLNKKAFILTPCINLSNSNSPILSLWYHAWGPDIGQLHVDLFDGNIITEDITTPVLGSQGDTWNEMLIDLSPWIGNVVALRIRGVTSCNDYGDLAIDDILVTNLTGMDKAEQKANSNLRLYPNPASSILQLRITNEYIGLIQVKIENLNGMQIRSGMLQKTEKILKTSIDISLIDNGLYIISGLDENGEILFRSKLLKL
jgi:hypothetical protein